MVATHAKVRIRLKNFKVCKCIFDPPQFNYLLQSAGDGLFTGTAPGLDVLGFSDD